MAINDAATRVERCEQAMGDLLVDWRLRLAVEALMAFKGFQIVAAIITVSELGALARFEHPRKLMAYLGLVPSESTSSDKRRQGSITKCGNPHPRWLLIECSQHYATPPKVSKELWRRQDNVAPEIIKVSWAAQNRLHRRFMSLMARRIHRNKVLRYWWPWPANSPASFGTPCATCPATSKANNRLETDQPTRTGKEVNQPPTTTHPRAAARPGSR